MDTYREEIAFNNVVHAVDDLGLDNSGKKAINDTLRSVSSDTLVEFPDGEYLVEPDNEIIVSDEKHGYVAADGASPTFVLGDGYDGRIFNTQRGEGFLFKGIDIDQIFPAKTGTIVAKTDRTVIKDVEWIGRAYDPETGVTEEVPMMNPSCTDPDGTSLVENVTRKKGIWGVDDNGGQTGIYLGLDHEGVCEVRGCDFREFPNNGMYASRCPGDVRIYDTYFENNGSTAFRIGGDGSFAENCTVVVNEDLYTGPTAGDAGFFHRGMWSEDYIDVMGIDKPAGCYVKNCEFIFENPPTKAPAIVVRGNGRSLEVIDCTIEYSGESPYGGIIVREELGSNVGTANPPHNIDIIRCDITGEIENRSVIHIIEGDKSTIEDTNIHVTGGANGIRVEESNDVFIQDTNVVVDGEAISYTDSDVKTENITNDKNESSDGDSSEDTDENVEWVTLQIDGNGSPATEYEFVVAGDARANDEDAEWGTVSDVELIDGDRYRVTGGVRGGIDAFDYNGCVESVELSNSDLTLVRNRTTIELSEAADCKNGTIVVDGEEITPKTLDRSLEIVGTGSLSRYQFSVDGAVESGPDTSDGNLSGMNAEGVVESQTAMFRFEGAITEFELDGDAGVYFDGNQVDPTRVDTDEDPFLSNWILVDGNGADTEYEFEVEGIALKAPDLGSVEADDEINDSSIIGSVTEGKDGYRFQGNLLALSVQGSANVSFNDS